VFALLFGASLAPVLAAYAAWLGVILWGARRARPTAAARRVEPSAAAFMLVLFFGLPTAFASVVAESWWTILIAFAIWFGLLGLFVVQGLRSRRVTNQEAVGWPMIMGMFLTMAAVPTLTLALRLTGLA
jgi:hypothetical protein